MAERYLAIRRRRKRRIGRESGLEGWELSASEGRVDKKRIDQHGVKITRVEKEG